MQRPHPPADTLPLELPTLFAYARAAACADEARHDRDVSGPRTSQKNEQTIRGWGGAALNDLEWNSRCIYPKEQREEFRRIYAQEYLRLRAARSGPVDNAVLPERDLL